MKKIRWGWITFWGVLFLALGIAGSMADTGHEGATRKEMGSYTSIRTIAPSSTSGTAFFASNVKRTDSYCKNWSVFVVWIGSVSATQNGGTHSNISNGFPLKSTDTFRLEGSFTGGDLYLTSDSGQGTGDVRCIDFLVR